MYALSIDDLTRSVLRKLVGLSVGRGDIELVALDVGRGVRLLVPLQSLCLLLSIPALHKRVLLEIDEQVLTAVHHHDEALVGIGEGG